LHEFFQAAMGWTNSHLHQFRVNGVRYGMQLEDCPEDELDEKTCTVIGAVGEVRQFFYDYDFGDGWSHEVVVEEITSSPVGLKHAVCVDGQRACPLEDVGGPPGYEEFLQVLANPQHNEYEFYVRWSGGGHDPEAFSLAATRVRARSWPRRRKPPVPCAWHPLHMNSDWNSFMARCQEALGELVEGRPDPFKALVTRRRRGHHGRLR
jgi:Plasmid pRiA4b ORF-3-like protein